MTLAGLLGAGVLLNSFVNIPAEAPEETASSAAEEAVQTDEKNEPSQTDGESTSARADEESEDLREYPLSPDWVAELPGAKDEKAAQLLIVEGTDMNSSAATVSLHSRDSEGGWRMILAAPAYIGRDGMCPDEEHAEGGVFTKTPIGTYRFNKAFGIADDPGCQLEYVKVDADDYWSGDDREGKAYNQLVSIRDYPDLDVRSSVHFVDSPREYQYCLNISFNEEGSPGRGSAIFLRCMGDNTYTGGSVAVPEESMKMIMENVRPDCVVVTDTRAGLGGTVSGLTGETETGPESAADKAESSAAEPESAAAGPESAEDEPESTADEPEFTAYDADGMIQGKLVLQSDGFYYFNENLRYRDSGDGTFEGVDTGDILFNYDPTDGTDAGAPPEQESSFEVWDADGSRHGHLTPRTDSSFYQSDDGSRYAAIGAGSFYGVDTGDTLYNYEPAGGKNENSSPDQS